MKQPFKIAVVGCGDWGRHHVRTAHALGALAAFSDPSPERQIEMSRTYDIPHLSFEALLETPSLSGVILATPAATHCTLALQALHAGKHVFVEKPLSHHKDEIIRMKETARERNLFLMPGHLLLYHPAFQALTAQVEKGIIGQPQMIISRRANFGKIYPQESVLWDLGPHDLSMMLTLYQSAPLTVTAQGASLHTPDIHDLVTLHLTFPHGRQGFIFLSRMHPLKEQTLVIQGDQGSLIFDDTQEWPTKLILNPSRVCEAATGHIVRHPPSAVHLSSAEPLKAELEHFIRQSQSLVPSSQEAELGLLITQVLEAAQASLERGKTIDL